MQEQEREAISSLKQGDIAGLELLVRLYGLTAARTAYAITGDPQAAEDVAADAFVTVHDRIAQFNASRPFAPWFYRIVVNGALKAARHTHASLSSDASWQWLHQQIAPLPGPEEQALAHELRTLLLAAVYSLPPRQRAALVLRYYLDMDEASIARTLGCPLGTVKWRLHSAKAKLRRTLTPQLLGDE